MFLSDRVKSESVGGSRRNTIATALQIVHVEILEEAVLVFFTEVQSSDTLGLEKSLCWVRSGSEIVD